jgi:hypothetical protein
LREWSSASSGNCDHNCTARRIGLTRGARLPTQQRRSIGEVRKPQHLNPRSLTGRRSALQLPSPAVRQQGLPDGDFAGTNQEPARLGEE